MYMYMIICISLEIFIVKVTSKMKCSNDSPPPLPTYYLIEKCKRSKLGVVARANYTSLTSCRRLGIEKKALAFNFSPREAWNSKHQVEYTCEVLKCAEVKGGLSLANDTRFDYYSIYAKPVPHVNSTCVPATGMFYILKKKLNYTQAIAECKNMSGVLADVNSEQRTDTLAQFLAGASLVAAYVAMRRHNGSTFYRTNGGSLQCSTYRAWAPGHPKSQYKKYECVVITRLRTWRSTPCKTQFPVLCELIPAGPYKRGSIFPSIEVNGLINYTISERL